ncbi:ATP-binding protein [Pseudogracilibacillus sp. SE30717A]|uniref:ATP-binding protein n=1 Tax=Pseudogracilibacillus sp. SE30717A TaxID=3098293 RepID=UPI00300DCC3F
MRFKPQNIIITIIDEGEGIPDQDLPYIFDRLYRIEKSRSRQSGGVVWVWQLQKKLLSHMVDSRFSYTEIGEKIRQTSFPIDDHFKTVWGG